LIGSPRLAPLNRGVSPFFISDGLDAVYRCPVHSVKSLARSLVGREPDDEELRQEDQPMPEELTENGIVVQRRTRSRKRRPKQAPVVNQRYAEGLMDSADGAEGTDSQWTDNTKLDYIDKCQAEGVDSNGERTKIYIHFDGVDTVDIDTGEIIPRPE
tara:strand:- start:2545 stop:3015 length:471 start_codon:yes stop_codon:yes gene_type:complete